MGRVTWCLNEYHHLEIWLGDDPDLGQQSDVYVQEDNNVSELLNELQDINGEGGTVYNEDLYNRFA